MQKNGTHIIKQAYSPLVLLSAIWQDFFLVCMEQEARERELEKNLQYMYIVEKN